MALPIVGATGAHAAPVSVWDKVAACESTNNWSINTGNGFYGGLQFTQSTWAGFGGARSTPPAPTSRPRRSRSPSRRRSWRPRARRPGRCAARRPVSPRRWPTRRPLRAGRREAGRQGRPPGQEARGPEGRLRGAKSARGSYKVAGGDTLSKIAKSQSVEGGWQKLYANNKPVIGGNPNLIYPGQVLSLGEQAFAKAAPSAAKAAPSAAKAASASGYSAPLDHVTLGTAYHRPAPCGPRATTPVSTSSPRRAPG